MSSYPLPRSRLSQVTPTPNATRLSDNHIQQQQQTKESRYSVNEKAKHGGKNSTSPSNYYRKAKIYEDIQRRIASNVTSPGGLNHRGAWTNSTLVAKQHQHRLRMKYHRMRSKGKRLRSRKSSILSASSIDMGNFS